MPTTLSNGRHQGGCRRPGSDDHHLLALEIEVLRPGLRVNHRAGEPIQSGPVRRIALAVAVVALAHPQEVGREPDVLPRVCPSRLDPPLIVGMRPRGRVDAVAVADVPGQVVLLDDLAQVGPDLLGSGDRGPGPRLEPVTERIEVAIGPDPRVAMGQPGAPKALLGLEHHERRTRPAGRQVVGSIDAGNTGPHHQDVDVLDRRSSLIRPRRRNHGSRSSPILPVPPRSCRTLF